MDLLETYYDKRAFTLYALLVAIPGKSVWLRRIFIVFSVLLLSAATIAQALKLVIEGFKIHLIIEILPMNTATGATLAHVLYTVYVASEEFETLLSVMLRDLLEERSKEDEAIKKRFASDAKYYVNVFSVIIMAGMAVIWFSGFIPRLLDLVIPLNETRPNGHILNGEIFLDQEKYYYQVYFFECCTIFVVAVSVGVSEAVCIIIIQHLCGMFAVVGFAARVTEFYDIPLSMVLIATFCAFTASLVQVTDPQLINAEIASFTVVQVCQFFIVSYMGQFVINSSEELTENAYNAKWDICEPSMRKILQMVILRSSKPCPIVARGMYVLSIENFMSVIQTAMSFFMVLRQA